MERYFDAKRRLSEALQNSLLSTPPRSPDAEIAVRYQPAAPTERRSWCRI